MNESLFDLEFRYTKNGERIYNHFYRLILPIFEKCCVKGYSPRELASLIHHTAIDLECMAVLTIPDTIKKIVENEVAENMKKYKNNHPLFAYIQAERCSFSGTVNTADILNNLFLTKLLKVDKNGAFFRNQDESGNHDYIASVKLLTTQEEKDSFVDSVIKELQKEFPSIPENKLREDHKIHDVTIQHFSEDNIYNELCEISKHYNMKCYSHGRFFLRTRIHYSNMTSFPICYITTLDPNEVKNYILDLCINFAGAWVRFLDNEIITKNFAPDETKGFDHCTYSSTIKELKAMREINSKFVMIKNKVINDRDSSLQKMY